MYYVTCYKVACDKIAFVWLPFFMLHATNFQFSIRLATSCQEVPRELPNDARKRSKKSLNFLLK